MRPLASARLRPLAVFAVAVFTLSWAVMAFTREMYVVAAVWPCDALAVALTVRWSRGPAEDRRILTVLALALGAANLVEHTSPAFAAVLVALNLASVAASVRVVRRFGGPMDGLKPFAAYIAGPVVAFPLASAVCVGLVLKATQPGAEPLEAAVRWFWACGLGMAILGAFALSVRFPSAREPMVNWRRFLLGQAAVLVGACVVLSVHPTAPPLFLLAPIVVVGALSHRELGGVCAVAITALVAWAWTLMGHGPAAVADLAGVNRVRLMQGVLAAMAFTALPISALLRRLDAYAAELEERRARAEELNALKTRLLAHVSHEIRSPLSGVTTLAALMRDGALGELTAEQREIVGRIAASGAEVDQLARDLTDAAAIQTGKAQVHIERVLPAEALAAAEAVARFRVAEHGAVVETCGAEAPAVAADPLRLRQILVNLMVNAAKYGGSPPRVVARAAATGRGTVRFEVADNGPGVAPDRRAALFRDFERLGAEKVDLDGSGLGLALSSEIARLQNGDLGVGDSEFGGGLFWLELPLWDEAAGAEAA